MTSTSKIIWTRHALERIGQRGLAKSHVEKTVGQADITIDGKQPHTKELQRQFGQSRVTVIVKPNAAGEQVILSCWVDPPIVGSAEWKHRSYDAQYRKAKSRWQQLWIILKKQLGI